MSKRPITKLRSKEKDQPSKYLSSCKPSSSLIEILQSFGINVKTKVKYHDQRKTEDFEQHFLEQLMKKRNFEPVVNEGGDKSIRSHQSLEYVNTNSKQAKIILGFKCFDHLKSFTSITSDKKEFNSWKIETKKEVFQKMVSAKDRNVMHIEFDLKFDSFVEVVKYLNVSNFSNVKLMLENEILSRLVEILDVDYEKKQVYIKLKTFDTKENKSNTNASFYYLMGKIDGTDSCFMLDLTYTNERSHHLDTIDNIYRYFTPKFLKDRIYGKGRPNTFHDCKDVGIYRVLIGSFFYCMTQKSVGSFTRYSTINPYDFNKIIVNPLIGSLGSYGIIAQCSFEKPYHYFDHETTYYSGIIDTGFYNFELKSLCRLSEGKLEYRSEFYHFSF